MGANAVIGAALDLNNRDELDSGLYGMSIPRRSRWLHLLGSSLLGHAPLLVAVFERVRPGSNRLWPAGLRICRTAAKYCSAYGDAGQALARAAILRRSIFGLTNTRVEFTWPPPPPPPTPNQSAMALHSDASYSQRWHQSRAVNLSGASKSLPLYEQ